MMVMARLRILVVMAALASAGAAACASEPAVDVSTQSSAARPAEAAPHSGPATGESSAPGRYQGPLPVIPLSPYAAAPPDVMRAVYEFAARRPDVLRYVPCFCGCERDGHQNNEDCFVAGRAADGRPQWDAHGLT